MALHDHQPVSHSGAWAAVALDLDGTLARADALVSHYAISVLSELQKQQIYPIIVTGRLAASALNIAHAAQLTAPIISGGGGVVIDPTTNEILVHATLPLPTISRLCAIALEYDVQPVAHSTYDVITDRRSRQTDMIEEINQEPAHILPVDQWPTELVKFMLVGTATEIDAVQAAIADEFPDMKRSSPEFLEANAPGFTKWESLEGVLNGLGISPQQTAGAGDGETDVEWLSNIGHVIAVDNADPRIQALAHRRLGHHDDDVVARYLATWL